MLRWFNRVVKLPYINRDVWCVPCFEPYLLLPYTATMTGRVDHVLPGALVLWAIAAYRRPFLAGVLCALWPLHVVMGSTAQPESTFQLLALLACKRSGWQRLTVALESLRVLIAVALAAAVALKRCGWMPTAFSSLSPAAASAPWPGRPGSMEWVFPFEW